MVNANFGYPELETRTEVDWLLENVNQVDSLSAQLLLREAYETSYAIANHRHNETHPWSLVLLQSKEDYAHYGTLYRTIHLFRLRDIAKRFGLNLTEYLELPREVITVLANICEQEDREDGKAFDALKDQFEQEFDNPKAGSKPRK